MFDRVPRGPHRVDFAGVALSTCDEQARFGSSAPCVRLSGHDGWHEDTSGRPWKSYPSALINKLLEDAHADIGSTMEVSSESKETK